MSEHAADLALAQALAGGDPAALREFEARLVPEIRGALARVRLPGGAADEVVQAMRVDLLVGDDGHAPRIAEYEGRGELAAWLRVSATRAAWKLLRKTHREETLDDVLLEHWPDATPEPERAIKSAYAQELKGALSEALAALEVRQRNLLRQHVLDDLTIDELALLYRVHRATCARWLADARAELAKGTKRRLMERLGRGRARLDEVESLLRWLDSDIELSISRILRVS